MAKNFYQQYTQKAFAPKANANPSDDEPQAGEVRETAPATEPSAAATTPDTTPQGEAQPGANATAAQNPSPVAPPPVQQPKSNLGTLAGKPDPQGGKPITAIQRNDTNPDNYPAEDDEDDDEGNTDTKDTKNPIAGIDYDDPHFFTKLTQILTEKPTMTKEEAEKQDKSARAAHDMASLAHGITAIANVALSGEAPSQVLPELYKINPTKYADQAKAERIKYAQSMLGAAGKDHAAKLSRDKAKADANYNNLKLQLKMAEDRAQENYRAATLELQKAKTAQAKAIAEKKLKMAERQLNETARHHRQMESKAGNTKQTWDPLVIKGPNGQTRSYDMNKDQEVHQYWQQFKAKGLYDGFPDEEPKTAAERRAYIYSHLNDFVPGSSQNLGHNYTDDEKDDYFFEHYHDGGGWN